MFVVYKMQHVLHWFRQYHWQSRRLGSLRDPCPTHSTSLPATSHATVYAQSRKVGLISSPCINYCTDYPIAIDSSYYECVKDARRILTKLVTSSLGGSALLHRRRKILPLMPSSFHSRRQRCATAAHDVDPDNVLPHTARHVPLPRAACRLAQ